MNDEVREALPAGSAWNRRTVLRLGSGLGVGALLAACGGGSGGDGADSGDGGSGGGPGNGPDPQPSLSLPASSQAYSVLKRTSFGVRQDTLDEIARLGVAAYLERQLAYESLGDGGLDLLLGINFTTINLPASVTRLGFPDNSWTLITDLLRTTLLRQFLSPRQLYEVMAEFWSNHFAIDLRNGLEPILKPVDDRSVIRPHALGNFRSLLLASARSPAMLFSLDNFLNVKGAPNENYARELMELHTLGVDGGYTEQDIKEVARCFTGWSINFDTGDFLFNAAAHDDGAKTVLGQTITAGGGQQDGERVLDMLARHSATATHIATKLCRRFIADQPPAAVIAQVARSFQDSGGDIRTTLRTLFASRDFLDARDTKFDRPVEFVGQIVRGLSQTLAMPADRGEAYVAVVDLLGQLPFFWAPPDGYPDLASHWASTSGFLNRWRIALFAIGSGTFNLKPLAGTAGTITALVDAVSAALLHRPLTADDRQTLIAWLGGIAQRSADAPIASAHVDNLLPPLVAMLICSAYFQLR